MALVSGSDTFTLDAPVITIDVSLVSQAAGVNLLNVQFPPKPSAITLTPTGRALQVGWSKASGLGGRATASVRVTVASPVGMRSVQITPEGHAARHYSLYGATSFTQTISDLEFEKSNPTITVLARDRWGFGTTEVSTLSLTLGTDWRNFQFQIERAMGSFSGNASNQRVAVDWRDYDSDLSQLTYVDYSVKPTWGWYYRIRFRANREESANNVTPWSDWTHQNPWI